MKAQQHLLPYLLALNEFPDIEAIRSSLLAEYSQFALNRLRQVVIIGVSTEGVRLFQLCHKYGIEVLGVCDGNAEKQGKDFFGYKIRSVKEALKWGLEVPIIVASHRPLPATVELSALGALAVAPFALLQILYPAKFPAHMFYANWLEDLFVNRNHYLSLASHLENSDALSLQTLNAIIGFRLTLNVTLLDPVLDHEAFMSRDLVSFQPKGTYVDGGAFDGDTVRRYIVASGGQFSRIIAFEPDPVTFASLKLNFENDTRIEPINAGLSRCAGVLRFVSDASRAALLSEQGDLEVPVISIDAALLGAPVSYIKLNIEGAELDTLEGARESILRWKPTLAISAYHAPDHLWRVAELIHAIEPSYKLHLRQQDNGFVETVIYAIQ
jgi:FkbM family methyltransferase